MSFGKLYGAAVCSLFIPYSLLLVFLLSEFAMNQTNPRHV